MLLDMPRSKEMGLGAMFVLLVVVIILLPAVMNLLRRFTGVHFEMDGFQDVMKSSEEVSVPSIGASAALPSWVPDPNTNYLCRAPHGGATPCPEGTFCDGTTQMCIPTYVGNSVPDVGYFS
jgi:hypothetical protein